MLHRTKDEPVRLSNPRHLRLRAVSGHEWFSDSGEDAPIFAYGAPAESKAEILESS